MNKIEAAVRMKCPRCQKGDVFETRNPYKKMTAMKQNCPHCGLKYEKEHGFFYGAMYVSYMLNIALFVTFVVAYFLVFRNLIDWRIYITIYVLLTLILVPVYYRLSRSIWLQAFHKYDEKYS
jgi:uncharacterized protein (DUF983 family)